MVTYTDLVARVKNWLEDDYAEFDADIDNMIELAEFRISKELNVDAMIVYQKGNLVPGERLFGKDEPVVAVRNFFIIAGTERVPVFFRSNSFVEDFWPDHSKTKQPRYYSNYDQTQWAIAPTPDLGYAVEIETEQRIRGLSETTPTTWLSVNAPDLLFYACALEGGVFDRDTEDGTRFAELYQRALDNTKLEVARVRSDLNNVMNE